MLYELTVPQFIKMLNNLNHILDKGAQYAETKKFAPEILLNSRLAPDQFALTRQVQIACDTAKLTCHRLTGKDAPVFEDNEATLPEVKARIDKTVQFLKTMTPADFVNAESKHVTNPRWEGQWMTGEELVHHHSLPNFYFHITTAYSILRHNGVDIGKKDYLGALPLKK